MKLIRCALLLLALLALPAHGASLRMDALGTDLIGIVDDPATDMTEYPEGNTFRTDWLTGLELRKYDWYVLRALKPGSLSVGAELSSYMGTAGVMPHLKIPVSFRAAGLGWGAALGIPEWYSVGPETTQATYTRFTDEGTLGACWSGSNLRLDARLFLSYFEGEKWADADTGGEVRHAGDRTITSLQPSVRLDLDYGTYALRTMLSYERNVSSFVDDEPTGYEGLRYTWSAVTPCIGFVYKPGPQLTAAIALKPRVSRHVDRDGPAHWTLALWAPAGVEWTAGILTGRVGAELGIEHEFGIDDVPSFSRYLTAGLAVKPVPRLTLDFNPSVEDVSKLTEWQLGATYTF